MQPSLRKFRSIEAIWHCTPAPLRGELGPLDGVELLVGAALEISDTETKLVGHLGMDRNECLGEAAIAMAPHDLERALRLIDLIGPNDFPDKKRGAVYAAAGDAAPETDAQDAEDQGSAGAVAAKRFRLL